VEAEVEDGEEIGQGVIGVEVVVVVVVVVVVSDEK